MALSCEMLDAMLAAELTAEQIVKLVKASLMEEKSEIAERRAKDAERKRRQRVRESRDVTGRHAQSVDAADVDKLKKEIPPTPPKEKNNNIKNNQSRARIREALTTVLSPQTAEALIDHRKAKKAPLTIVAAERLAAKFAKTRDGPENAALTMIDRGWQGFEPHWIENDDQRNSKPNAGKSRYADFLGEYALHQENGGSSGREPGFDLHLIEGGGGGIVEDIRSVDGAGEPDRSQPGASSAARQNHSSQRGRG